MTDAMDPHDSSFDWMDEYSDEYAEWMDTISDPIHGRDDVPKSYLRMGTRLTAVKSGGDIKRVTIHPKTTENAEEWITSDAWLDAEDCL